MASRIRRMLAGLAIAAAVVVSVVACAPATAPGAPAAEAVTVEEIVGTDLKRLALSESAALRLGVATAPVTASAIGGTQRTAIPYSALIYDAAGGTWTYTSPDPRVFVRHEVTVDEIADDLALLTAGPDVGTLVVTVGAAELWGVETGVGGGH